MIQGVDIFHNILKERERNVQQVLCRRSSLYPVGFLLCDARKDLLPLSPLVKIPRDSASKLSFIPNETQITSHSPAAFCGPYEYVREEKEIHDSVPKKFFLMDRNSFCCGIETR